jgi:hypothetical protein
MIEIMSPWVLAVWTARLTQLTASRPHPDLKLCRIVALEAGILMATAGSGALRQLRVLLAAASRDLQQGPSSPYLCGLLDGLLDAAEVAEGYRRQAEEAEEPIVVTA